MFAHQQHDRRRFFGTAAFSLAAAWIGTRDSVMNLVTVEPFRQSGASDLASLGRATAWLNSALLTPADLQGKVVLVDFWTYTCINWLRTSQSRELRVSWRCRDEHASPLCRSASPAPQSMGAFR